MFELSKQKSQTIFLKAVCVPPTWPDHFVLMSPFQSIRIRQLCADEPISISQANFVHTPFSISQANFVLMSPFQSVRQTLSFCLFFIHLFHIIHCRFIHWLLYSFVHIVIMCIIYYALYSSVCIIYYVHYLFMHTVQ
jgi:hypothetical protein